MANIAPQPQVFQVSLTRALVTSAAGSGGGGVRRTEGQLWPRGEGTTLTATSADGGTP